MKEIIIGIDLGTTNSAVAYVKNGAPCIIPIDGQSTMPSCVGLDPSGNLVVGQAARNMLITSPESTVLSVKRLMGKDIQIPLGEKTFSPEEISAFILRRLKDEAEKFLGQLVPKAVVTVPAFFDERQRKATRDAGTLAGLDIVRIINEPTAAALAYHAGHTGSERILVYDLGGGTFDVSVVVIEGGVVEVKASQGDTHLGGDDFDQLLVEDVVKQFEKREHITLGSDLKTSRRLKLALERAKCQLSDEPFVKVQEEYIQDQSHLQTELDRTAFEALITPLLEKTLTCVKNSLRDAALLPKDLAKVLLVGGATRSPIVHQILEETLGIQPRWEINPDLIVALGASVAAASFAGESTNSILVDIAAHSFGIAALITTSTGPELQCMPIIKRNTPLPVSKSEAYTTIRDNQDIVQIQVYEGEGLYPEDNTLIGEFKITGLAKVPAGNPVIVSLNLDLNGMLKVTALEKATGLQKVVTMDTSSNGVTSLDLEAAQKNIQSLLSDVSTSENSFAEVGQLPDGAHKELLATAKDLRQRAEALLLGAVPDSDAAEMRALLEQISETIRAEDWEQLQLQTDTLSDIVFFLED